MTSEGAFEGSIDLSLPHLERPHIRSFRSQAGKTPEGQPVIRLDDPLRLSAQQIVLSANVIPLLARFSGENSVDEIVEQFQIPKEKLAELVELLERNYFLWGPTFEQRERALREELDAAGTMPRGIAFAFGDDADALHKQFDEWLTEVEDPELEATPRALVMPHLDYSRSWPLLAAGYCTLPKDAGFDRVIVLGSNHFGIGDGVIGTNWAWETPFGFVPRDEALLAGLRDRLGDGLFVDALDHIAEPSIQIHLPWIQHCLGDVPVTGWLLPDPLQKMLSDDGKRTSLDEFTSALRELLSELGGTTLVIGSCDLSHVGPQFGEPAVVDEDRRALVEEQDRNMLALFVAGDNTGFLEGLTWSNNPTRWCSVGGMSALLALFEGDAPEIELIDYRQAYDDSGHWLVSAATCAIL